MSSFDRPQSDSARLQKADDAEIKWNFNLCLNSVQRKFLSDM